MERGATEDTGYILTLDLNYLPVCIVSSILGETISYHTNYYQCLVRSAPKSMEYPQLQTSTTGRNDHSLYTFYGVDYNHN